MEPARSIGRLGFRKWYERRLIESHAWLVTALLWTHANANAQPVTITASTAGMPKGMALTGDTLATKLITLIPGNAARGLPTSPDQIVVTWADDREGTTKERAFVSTSTDGGTLSVRYFSIASYDSAPFSI